MWIIGRVGILAVFGIMPLMHSCDRIKTAPLRKAQREMLEAYDETYKYPVLSIAWESNRARADKLQAESSKLYEKFYGKPK